MHDALQPRFRQEEDRGRISKIPRARARGFEECPETSKQAAKGRRIGGRVIRRGSIDEDGWGLRDAVDGDLLAADSQLGDRDRSVEDLPGLFVDRLKADGLVSEQSRERSLVGSEI